MLYNDTKTIQAFARRLVDEPDIDFVTVTDDSGLVVGRGHSDKVGDSVGKNRDSIWLPLKGKPVTGVEPGSIVKLTMGAGVPIIYNDQIIGAMTLGMDMTNGAFVNRIKEQLGVECTIFENDVRVSTTVLNSENKPAVGTKLDNNVIYDKVMTQGSRYAEGHSLPPLSAEEGKRLKQSALLTINRLMQYCAYLMFVWHIFSFV